MVTEIAVGVMLGFLSALGIGGGSLLMLWLTGVKEYGPDTARAMNLLFFLPCALTGTLMRWKSAAADRRLLICTALTGMVGAAVGSLISLQMESDSMLRKGLSLLFLVTGIREIGYRDRKLR